MRRVTIAIVCMVVLGSLPLAVSGASLNASISNVDVTPSTPAPGETVQFDTTVRNLESSDAPLEINAIAVRKSGGRGITEYDRVEDLGSLSPGSTLDVPLTASFDSEGSKSLRVIVYGRDRGTGENVELRYPVRLNVQERHPQVDFDVNESVAGVESEGRVTVANGMDSKISNVEVVVDGDTVEMTKGRAVAASIADNGSMTAPFRFRPESSGTHELTATVHYTVDGTTDRTTSHTTTIETDPLKDNVSIETAATGSGSDRALEVTVANQANVPISDVAVYAESANASFQRVLIDEIPASTSRQVQLNASMDEPQASVTVAADYELGTTDERVTTTTELRSVPGTIDLTGLNVVRQGDRFQISGSASNVGSTRAQSVLVTVVDSERVTPAEPNRDFFVGTVPASDFVSFDVYARTDGNVSSVPLEVTYLVDDDRKRQTFMVDVPNRSGGIQPEEQDGGGGTQNSMIPVLVVGGLAVLLVAGVLVRRYRRDDEVDI